VEGTQVLDSWRGVEGVSNVVSEDGRVTVLAGDSNHALPRLFDAANTLGARITSVDIQEPNLEMVFLHLTGRALRD
jgi:ABC-2 type transport system ATP-binding protein